MQRWKKELILIKWKYSGFRLFRFRLIHCIWHFVAIAMSKLNHLFVILSWLWNELVVSESSAQELSHSIFHRDRDDNQAKGRNCIMQYAARSWLAYDATLISFCTHYLWMNEMAFILAFCRLFTFKALIRERARALTCESASHSVIKMWLSVRR